MQAFRQPPSDVDPDKKYVDFFISYTATDRRWAEWIAWQLEDSGYAVRLQAWDFRPGSNFVLEMQAAAERAHRTLAVLSPDYLESIYAQPEWAAAFVSDPKGEQGKLVPVLVRKCILRGLLKAIIYINLVDVAEAEAREALLDGLRWERVKPKTMPPFPGKGVDSSAPVPKFPGEWPVVSGVPWRRNPNFVGRDSIIDDLRTAFISGDAKQGLQALYGLGGIGKTQIALEYAFRYEKSYYMIGWLRAEEAATLGTDYAALGLYLEIPLEAGAEGAKDGSLSRSIEAVRAWLERNGEWLLIFDNADALDVVWPFLPRSPAGHIILTSRNPNWLRAGSSREVGVLDQASAVDFLAKRTGQIHHAAANRLAKDLGYLPLALEQAGAYIEETGITIASYLALFRVERQKLLGRGAPSNYPATVATTWLISFKHLERLLPAAGDLLRLSSFFAPDSIPLDLFRDGASSLPSSLAKVILEPLALLEARSALRRYSLVHITDETFSIHRLVQVVVIDRLDAITKKFWAGVAVQVVRSAFIRQEKVARSPLFLLPHALSVAAHAENLKVEVGMTADLLDKAGLFLSREGALLEAKRCFERALAVAEEGLEDNKPKVATILNNLGSVVRVIGDPAKAIQCHERALALDISIYSSNHHAIAIDFYNLGLALFDLGEEGKARELFSKSISILLSTLGEGHEDTMLIRENIASLIDGHDWQPP